MADLAARFLREHAGPFKKARSAKLDASNRAHLVARAFVSGILTPSLCVLLMAAVLVQVATSGLGDARVANRPIRRRRDEIVLQRWA